MLDMAREKSSRKKTGGRPGGYRLEGARRMEGKQVAEVAGPVVWRLEMLEALVTAEDLAALEDGPKLRMEHQVLAVLLRKVRELRGWSRWFLAGMCRTSHQELKMLEAAMHGATVDMWFRLCEALRVPCYLFICCAQEVAAQGR